MVPRLPPGLHAGSQLGDLPATESAPPEGGEEEAPAEEGTVEGEYREF